MVYFCQEFNILNNLNSYSPEKMFCVLIADFAP